MSKIDLTWISKEMKPGVWYNIKDEEQLNEFKRQIEHGLGWPKFTLSLSNDYKQVKKTEL